MTVRERLCVLASPRSDDAKGATAHELRAAGLTLLFWPPADAHDTPPPAFDMLVVLRGGADLPAAMQTALVALLRQAWKLGATIGLFGGAAELLTLADIAPAGAPLEAEGLFVDEQQPAAGTLQEMVDSVQAGPHLER